MTNATATMAADPYPLYERMRGLRHSGQNLISHTEVREALAHPVLGVEQLNSVRRLLPEPLRAGALARTLGGLIAFRDGTAHARLRKALSGRFTGRSVEEQRPLVTEVATGLLDRLVGRSTADLRAEFAHPLPALVLSRLFGIGTDELGPLLGWADRLVSIMAAGTIEAATAQRWDDEMAAMEAYVGELVARQRAGSGDGLISRLLAAGVAADELPANVLFMVTAGHETSAALIASAIAVLLTHPDQLALLRADPSLVDAAVEETLRLESPLQNVGRVPATDVLLGGRVLRAGRLVNIVIGAANRDPDVFADPAEFRITRRPNPHLAFGHGIHFCLGAGLARLEAQVALPLLFERLPGLRLTTPEISWRTSIGFRGPERVDVGWEASPPCGS